MKKNVKKFAIIAGIAIFSQIQGVAAHCPLCTAGVAAAAGGAAVLGVEKAVIGLFVGAFAVSTGLWVARLVKKQYIPHQKTLLALGSFLLTVIPLFPIINQVYPVYISLAGEYGSIFNRTYVLNLPLFTSILGGLLVASAPAVSKRISIWRNGKIFPYQGVLLTLGLLIVTGALIQMVVFKW